MIRFSLNRRKCTLCSTLYWRGIAPVQRISKGRFVYSETVSRASAGTLYPTETDETTFDGLIVGDPDDLIFIDRNGDPNVYREDTVELLYTKSVPINRDDQAPPVVLGA